MFLCPDTFDQSCSPQYLPNKPGTFSITQLFGWDPLVVLNTDSDTYLALPPGINLEQEIAVRLLQFPVSD